LAEEGRDKDQGITDDLPAEFEKLLEIKGHEVFRVDSSDFWLRAATRAIFLTIRASICGFRFAIVRCRRGLYQDCSFEILANVPSNLVIVIVNGSAYDFARSLKMLSATCSPNKMDQNDELRK
jgi:hypothetical protein